MPQITQELIKQRKANGFPYPTPPSSVHTASPHESPSSRSRQSRNQKSSGLSNGADNHTSTCWIPTLDEVSRAGPAERRRIFQRLADEARRDEELAASRARNAGSRSGSNNPAPQTASTSKHSLSSAEIGAAAFRLIRPSATSPIETGPRPRRVPSEYSLYPEEAQHPFNALDNYPISEWRVQVPESPIAGVHNMRESQLTEEMIAQWVTEDQEYERQLEEERMLRLRGLI